MWLISMLLMQYILHGYDVISMRLEYVDPRSGHLMILLLWKCDLVHSKINVMVCL